MGLASSLAMTKDCLGPEISSAAVKFLAGATHLTIETLFAKSRTLGNSYGLDAEHIKQLFGDGHPGSHAEFILELMDQNKLGRIDFFEMIAAIILCGKIPARSKVRSLFDMFDFDLDGKLNSCEVILMLRSTLSAVAKVTGGVSPTTAGVDNIWRYIVRSGYLGGEDSITLAQWIYFCSRTREVHALGKALDFNKGVCRRALASGTRALLPPLVVAEEDPELVARREELAKSARMKIVVHREQKRAAAAAAREGKSKFGRSIVLRVKEVFDSAHTDGSGYVDEREWRRLTEGTPLGAPADTFLPTERQREGQISIVEVLCEVFPFASDGDLAKMLQWVSEEPTQTGAARQLISKDLAVAEPTEMTALFHMYGEGSGEITLRELSSAMADIVGLTKEDVMPMFSRAAKREEDYITASEFADILMEFVQGDTGIQSVMRPT